MLGTVLLQNAGATNVFFYDEFIKGTGTFQETSGSVTVGTCGPFTEPIGYYSVLRCKFSPEISSVTPLLPNTTARIVQSGTTITLSGSGFGQQCSTCQVTAYPGVSLHVSSWGDHAISVVLPATFNGITQITVQTASGSDVIDFMAAPAPVIAVSIPSLQFAYTVGGTIPPGQSLQITNSGGGTLTWSAALSASWLSVTPTSGTAPSPLTVSVAPAGLAAGTYSGTITISAAGVTSQIVSVTLTVATFPAILSSLSPANATAGGVGFTLTVFGSGFVLGSVVQWNGSNLTTTFVSATQLTATIPATNIAAAGTARVTVFNPAPGGGTSNALTFTITSANPAPAVSGLSPGSAAAGGAAFTLTVNGTNFISASVVQWNGSNRTTTFVSATKLTASIPGTDIASAGTVQVTVFNPPSGGGTSTALTFTITQPPHLVPTLSAISPSSATAGGASFALTVNGSNFISSSVMQWNGSNRTTTFVSSSQLTAAIPASDIATAGTALVTAFNPAPGGGTSNALTFTITVPPPPQPTINSGGIVNVASYTITSTSVASGSIAAIFGSNLSDGTVCVPDNCGPNFDSNQKVIPIMSGAQVSFNGIFAPILSTPGNGQLNVQIPVELAGAASATVQVTVKGQSSPSSTVSLAPLSPGLISINSSGAGQGAILNDKDANLGIQSLVAPVGSAPNAHPAAPGDVIEIYATGLGAMTPPVSTGMRPQGLPQTVTKPIVTIGGIPATVSFSGLASCCVGLNQVNVVVPPGTPADNAVWVVLSIGGAITNAVTIAVQ